MKRFYVSVIAVLQITLLLGHGFSADTLVLLADNAWQEISSVCYCTQKKKIAVASYDTASLWQTTSKTIRGGRSRSNCFIQFGFDEELQHSKRHEVACTPTQEFYSAITHQWIPAYKLKIGDQLLCASNATKTVTSISLVKEPLDIFTIEVKHTHTFFVTHHSLLTHNMVLPVAFSLGISIPFGASAGGAAGGFFGPITFLVGAAIGCAVGALVKVICNSKIPTYTVDMYNPNTFEQHVKQQPQIVTFSEPKIELSADCVAIQENVQQQPESLDDRVADDNNMMLCSTTIVNIPKEKPGCGDTTSQELLILITPADPIPTFQNPGYSLPLEENKTILPVGGCGAIPDELKDLFNKPLILLEDNNTDDTVNKILEGIKTNTEPGTETNGKSKQYIKKGDFENAKRDFESFKPSNIRRIPEGFAGDLSNGHTINVREKSSEGSPTLEILNPANKKKIKFRYRNN